MTCMSRAFVGLLLLLGLGFAQGCKKSQPAAGDSPTVASEPAAPPSTRGPGIAPLNPATGPVVISDSGDVNTTLERLTTELRKFVVGSRSVPRTFEEFAEKARLEFPAPPAGKKYKLAGQTIVLANK